jgi:hypothetical protein
MAKNQDATPGTHFRAPLYVEADPDGTALTALAAAITALTDSSGGTADGTVEAMPAAQATPGGATVAELTAINNNFAELATKVNLIRADLEALKERFE